MSREPSRKRSRFTFAWLDKAFEQRNGWLLHIKQNQRYDSLRTDPRYLDLVRRMNLP
jgi:hypothetical protein